MERKHEGKVVRIRSHLSMIAVATVVVIATSLGPPAPAAALDSVTWGPLNGFPIGVEFEHINGQGAVATRMLSTNGCTASLSDTDALQGSLGNWDKKISSFQTKIGSAPGLFRCYVRHYDGTSGSGNVFPSSGWLLEAGKMDGFNDKTRSIRWS